MTIEVHLDTKAAELLEKRLLQPEPMVQAMRRTMDEQNLYTIRKIIQERMTGKGPFPVEEHRMGVVTGHMRRSLFSTPAVPTRASGTSFALTSSIGSRARYAAAHEFGFEGDVTVRGYTRRAARQRARYDLRTGERLRAGRRTGGRAEVWGHVRRMRIPARAPVQTGILDRLPEYGRALSRAIVAAWKELT